MEIRILLIKCYTISIFSIYRKLFALKLLIDISMFFLQVILELIELENLLVKNTIF